MNVIKQLDKMIASLPHGYEMNYELSRESEKVWASYIFGLSSPLYWERVKWRECTSL